MMVVLFFSLLIPIGSLAQIQESKTKEDQEKFMHNHPVVKKPKEFPGIKSVARGIHDEFVIVEQGNYNIIYNNRNTLIHTYSSYMEHMKMELINLDKPLLDSYVEIIFSPYFGKKPNAFPEVEGMGVSLYADVDGNIKELLVYYPRDVKIPCSAIERFEDSIFNSSLKLIFDKNIPYFRDATWVSITWEYSAEELRKQGGKE